MQADPALLANIMSTLATASPAAAARAPPPAAGAPNEMQSSRSPRGVKRGATGAKAVKLSDAQPAALDGALAILHGSNGSDRGKGNRTGKKAKGA